MRTWGGWAFFWLVACGTWASDAMPSNAPPMVSAGDDMTIFLGDTSVVLAGTAQDDGLPNPPGQLRVWWSQASGPAAAVFADQHAASTSALFPAVGAYILRLHAADGAIDPRLHEEGLIVSSSQSLWEIKGIADFDGDGKMDIMACHRLNGKLRIWFLDGLRAKSQANIAGRGLVWRIAGCGDFDADGCADILYRHLRSGELWLSLLNGARMKKSGRLASSMPLSWQCQAVADFDGDSCADILWRHMATGKYHAQLMKGFAVKRSVNLFTLSDPRWQVRGYGDFDGDGCADILLAHVSARQTRVYLMNGLRIKAKRDIPFAAAGSLHGCADFSGDGKVDLLWHNAATGRPTIVLLDNFCWRGSGSPVAMAPGQWLLKGCGDLNGDGVADLVWQEMLTSRIYGHLMRAEPVFISDEKKVEVLLPETDLDREEYEGFIENGRPALIKLDRSCPRISDLIPVPGSTVTDLRPRLSAKFSDHATDADLGVDPDTCFVSLDGKALTDIKAKASGFSAKPAEDLANGLHTVCVSISDYAGNPQCVEWQFTLAALPGQPQALRAKAGDAKALLAWQKPDAGGKPQGYRIYADERLIGTVDAQTLKFLATGLTNQQQHIFNVRAYNEAGEGEAARVAITPSPLEINIITQPVQPFTALGAFGNPTFRIEGEVNDPDVTFAVERGWIEYLERNGNQFALGASFAIGYYESYCYSGRCYYYYRLYPQYELDIIVKRPELNEEQRARFSQPAPARCLVGDGYYYGYWPTDTVRLYYDDIFPGLEYSPWEYYWYGWYYPIATLHRLPEMSWEDFQVTHTGPWVMRRYTDTNSEWCDIWCEKTTGIGGGNLEVSIRAPDGIATYNANIQVDSAAGQILQGITLWGENNSTQYLQVYQGEERKLIFEVTLPPSGWWWEGEMRFRVARGEWSVDGAPFKELTPTTGEGPFRIEVDASGGKRAYVSFNADIEIGLFRYENDESMTQVACATVNRSASTYYKSFSNWLWLSSPHVILLNDDNDDIDAEPPDAPETDNQNARIDGEDDRRDMQTLTVGKVPANIRKGTVKLQRLPESVGKIRIFTPDGECVMEPGDAESLDLWERGLTNGDLALLVEGVEPGKVMMIARYQNDNGADFYPSSVATMQVIAFKAVMPSEAYDDMSLSEEERVNAEPREVDIIAAAQPRPMLEISKADGTACTSMDVAIDATAGVARLTLHGYVHDPLADNTPAGKGRDIASVTAFHRFLADDESGEETAVNTVPVIRLPEEQAGAKGFWRQHPYRGEFKNLKVAIPLVEGTHVVRVQTSPNILGQIAWDEIMIELKRFAQPAEEQEQNQPPAANPAMSILVTNLHIGQDLLSERQDEIRFYLGEREPILPPAANADMAQRETASDSLIFSGRFRDLRNRELPATIRITHVRSRAEAEPVNAPPLVNVGPDRFITANALRLTALAADDGLPPGREISCQWSKVSGPGNVVFSAPQSLATEVRLSVAGDYVLRLTVSDGELTAADEMRIFYEPDAAAIRNQEPRIQLPAAHRGSVSEPLALRALVVDDEMPENAVVSVTWVMVQGPRQALFADEHAANTTVAFDAPGLYVLRLMATDGSLFASADTIVSVAEASGALVSANQPLQFAPDQVDLIKATVEWDDPDAGRGSYTGEFVETGLDTRRFRLCIPAAACAMLVPGEENNAKPPLWLKNVRRGSRSDKGYGRPFNIMVKGLSNPEKCQVNLFDKTYDLEEKDGAWYLKGESLNHIMVCDTTEDGGIVLDEVWKWYFSRAPRPAIMENGKVVAERGLAVIYPKPWLVTHDPEWERTYALKYPDMFKQAELMRNRMVWKVLFPPGGDISKLKIAVCRDFLPTSPPLLYANCLRISDIKAEFQLRTYVDPITKRETAQNYTDKDGNIYIEGEKLTPGRYWIKVFYNSSFFDCYMQSIKIAPLMTNCHALFSDNLDPYQAVIHLPAKSASSKASQPTTGQSYGLALDYELLANSYPALETGINNSVAIMTVVDAPAEKLAKGEITGDMGHTHLLVGKSFLIPSGYKKMKWEGFNPSLSRNFQQPERADEIFMDGETVVRNEEWGPASPYGGKQHKRAAAPWDVAAEGRYVLRFGLSPAADTTQRQMFEACISVNYQAHDAFCQKDKGGRMDE